MAYSELNDLRQKVITQEALIKRLALALRGVQPLFEGCDYDEPVIVEALAVLKETGVY